MNRILRAIAILLVIAAVVFAAGCSSNKQTNTTNYSQNSIHPATEATPAPTPFDPKLAISPDKKFFTVKIDDTPSKVDYKVTMKSILGDAYNISLNAHPNDENNLSVKVDDIEGSPFLTDKISEGDKQHVNVSVEIAPHCPSGNYTIALNAIYHDITNQEYSSSDSIIINVEHPSLVDRGSDILNGIIKQATSN